MRSHAWHMHRALGGARGVYATCGTCIGQGAERAAYMPRVACAPGKGPAVRSASHAWHLRQGEGGACGGRATCGTWGRSGRHGTHMAISIVGVLTSWRRMAGAAQRKLQQAGYGVRTAAAHRAAVAAATAATAAGRTTIRVSLVRRQADRKSYRRELCRNPRPQADMARARRLASRMRATETRRKRPDGRGGRRAARW